MAAQDDVKEQESVDLLMAMMGDTVSDPEVARRVLHKCDGDLQKAATAILEGDRGEDRPKSPVRKIDVKAYSLPPSAPGKNSPTGDLTTDDDSDQLARALKASLETNQALETQFGPNQRPSDAPNWDSATWTVVTTDNKGGPSMSQDDQAMDRAIQESLQGSYNDFADEVIEERTVEDLIRLDNRPIALRPTKATLAYAALIIQGLFFVPQVRMGISRFRPSVPLDASPNPYEDALWSLAETYTNMEIALLAELDANPCLAAFEAQEWTNPTDHPSGLSRNFYRKLAGTVEAVFFQQFVTSGSPGPRPRLFQFLYGYSNNDTINVPSETEIVTVTIGGNRLGDSNDLMSCLSSKLSPPPDQPQQQQQCIFEPSDVVAFELVGSSVPSSAWSFGNKATETKQFKYPKYIHMDQFLQVNAEITSAKRVQQRQISDEVERLILKRKSLTSFNNKDTLKDLRASVYYYEHVADARGDLIRQADIERTGGKLKRILSAIENEIESIDAKIIQLKADSALLFETPDLQKLRYDLRVVFIHDGIFGRKHLYSYVHDKGKWWKTVDNTVTEVPEETVFNDRAGLHLAAGPYLLLYSKALSSEHLEALDRLPWPTSLKNSAKHNNKQFLSQIKPEAASNVHDFNSPPTSPTGKSAPMQPPGHPATMVSQSQGSMDTS